MFIEIAQFMLRDGTLADFEKAVAALAPDIEAIAGCQGVEMVRPADSGAPFVMLMRWDTRDAQAAFYQSAPAAAIGPLAEQFFAAPPAIIHGHVI